MAGVLFHQFHELLTGVDAQGNVLVSRVFEGSVPEWIGWAADAVTYAYGLVDSDFQAVRGRGGGEVAAHRTGG